MDSPEWKTALAGLIAQIGRERFPSALRTFLEQGCAFDSMIVTQYPPGARPITHYHDLDELQAAITVQFYSTGPYLLDPLYQHCRNNGSPGAYRLVDVSSDAFLRSEYYRTFYRKIQISDELGLTLDLGDEGWIIVSLARSNRRPRFSVADVERAGALHAIVSAAVLRHWQDHAAGKPADDWQLEERLKSFGTERLSAREAQIVQLVLQGHSSRSLAAFLGISEGTVKVHRHNAYSKLGITSQAELFSLATRHFEASRR